jgi:hypothetical protein
LPSFVNIKFQVAFSISFYKYFIYLVIKDQPEKPPSIAQLEIRKQTEKYENQSNTDKETDFALFKKSLKNLVKNFNFDLILVSYGMFKI